MKGISDLHDAVQRDLAWRKREISAIRALSVQIEDEVNFVCRAGQVLLCAHWEGFLKKASKLYMEHVFLQKLRPHELTPNLLAVAFFSDVMLAATAKYPGSDDHHIRLAKKIIETQSHGVVDPAWNVDTEGNPGSAVLERILKSIGVDLQLGMDEASWATTKVFINEQLVRDRHRIAHGEGLPIDKNSLMERTDRLLRLLDTLCDEILKLAERQGYRS